MENLSQMEEQQMSKETTNITENLNFVEREDRVKFIQENESGLYAGKTTDGKDVIVLLDQGKGMTVKWLNSKGWYEGFNYDEKGFVEDEILEKAR
jgi:hypothetical protein